VSKRRTGEAVVAAATRVIAVPSIAVTAHAGPVASRGQPPARRIPVMTAGVQSSVMIGRPVGEVLSIDIMLIQRREKSGVTSAAFAGEDMTFGPILSRLSGLADGVVRTLAGPA
jgi:hypothetical protein